MLAACRESGTAAATSTITPSISTTDCAEDDPRSRLITPSRYTLTNNVSVDLPGPPLVSAQIGPNVSNAAYTTSTTSRKNTVGISSGSVMVRNRCQPRAPSMRAASVTARGMDCSPATKKM